MEPNRLWIFSISPVRVADISANALIDRIYLIHFWLMVQRIIENQSSKLSQLKSSRLYTIKFIELAILIISLGKTASHSS